MIAAANRNDFDAQLACFTPDAEYRFDTYSIMASGREAIRPFLERFLATFPDRQIAIQQIISDADRAAAEYHYVATSPGRYPGVAARGRTVHLPPLLGLRVPRRIDLRRARLCGPPRLKPSWRSPRLRHHMR